MILLRWLASMLLGLVLVHPVPTGAAPVDDVGARETATAFLDRHDVNRTIGEVVGLESDGTLWAHLCLLAPSGYVVVPGDDRLPPVLAYAFDSACPPAAAGEHPLVDLVTADVRSRLAAYPQIEPSTAEAWQQAWTELRTPGDSPGMAPGMTRFQQWPPEGSTPTGGWLQSNWTQNPPYNDYCPLDLAHGGSRSVAGCPAVAMAMIVNHHETIQGTALGDGDRYYHSYSGNYYWIPDAAVEYDFPDFETLNIALEKVTLHWNQSVPLTGSDKAALVFACGVAARQVYSASISGTYGLGQAYDAFQRFGFTDCRVADESDPNFYPDLTAQMQNAQPAHLAVVDPPGTMGHNLVIDGYNTDDFYHLNFGWGGAYNGWYLLPDGIPYGLTVIDGVIFDIVPPTASAEPPAVVPAASELTCSPNPAAGTQVRLGFAMPEAGHARLGVYDVGGRLQALVLDGHLPQGDRSIEWAPAGLTAGVYWLRLEVTNQTVIRRMVVQP